MDITLDQAMAFDAVASLGTVQKAAEALNKGHSAILYSIGILESQVGVQLFDRSGYRNKVSLQGEIVLNYCRRLIQTRNELEMVCEKLKHDWEPSLKLIYDGVVDFNLIGDALFLLNKSRVPTEIKVLAAYVHEVETTFDAEAADMMVTILPIQRPGISSIALEPIPMLLVAHREHALARSARKTVTADHLKNHSFIQIRGVRNPLGLSTEHLNHQSYFSVNDFATKKQAIMKQLGYGWLPKYLIEGELRSGTIKVLRTEPGIENEHQLKPRLYHRKEDALGRTSAKLLEHFRV
jgi:DNA-binding transcriptional LysR family regulator